MLVLVTLILVLMVLFSAFLSGSETAFFSLSSFTVQGYKSSTDVRKKMIANMLQKPMDLLVTLMMLNILANILVQNTVSSLLGGNDSWALNVGLPLFLTLIFGEVIPKSVAIVNNASICYKVVPILSKISRFLGPVRIAITKITISVSRMLFFFLKREEKTSIDELYTVLKTSHKAGIVHQDESDLVEGYLDLRSSIAKEIMRPRDEILFYDLEKPLSELIRLFVTEECSKVPVCVGDLQDTKGILTIDQYFYCKDQLKKSQDIVKRLKKPFYVPESINGWTLFQTLRAKNEEIALVVDEYGSIAGLITLEDLFEWVIGEIEDKRDTKSLYTQSGSDVIIASGKFEIDELEELFDLTIDRPSNAVTIGGYLIEQLGEIPPAGTKYVTDDFLFYVLAAEPNRVRRVYIRRLKHKGRKK